MIHGEGACMVRRAELASGAIIAVAMALNAGAQPAAKANYPMIHFSSTGTEAFSTISFHPEGASGQWWRLMLFLRQRNWVLE